MDLRQIINCSYADISNYIDDTPYVIILFHDNPESISLNRYIENGAEDLLVFNVNDIVYQNWDGRLFTEAHAITLKNFIKKYEYKISKFIVCCPTGISRSGAASSAIRAYFNSKTNYFDPLNHNHLIYHLLYTVLLSSKLSYRIKKCIKSNKFFSWLFRLKRK